MWDEDIYIHHNRANAVTITNVETGEVNTYNSVRDAERITGIWRGNLKKYSDNHELFNGLKIEYANKK